MCSVSTNDGKRASPAQGSQVIGCLLTIVDKHANVKSLPEYQELGHISVHKCIFKSASPYLIGY